MEGILTVVKPWVMRSGRVERPVSHLDADGWRCYAS